MKLSKLFINFLIEMYSFTFQFEKWTTSQLVAVLSEPMTETQFDVFVSLMKNLIKPLLSPVVVKMLTNMFMKPALNLGF